jgi:hypothetical protein
MAIALKRTLKAGKSITRDLRYHNAKGSWVRFGPSSYTLFRKVAAKSRDSTAVARSRQDALIRRKASRSDAQSDQTPVLPSRKPDEACATVRAAWWIVRMDQPSEWDALVAIAGCEGKRIANYCRLEVPPLVARTE